MNIAIRNTALVFTLATICFLAPAVQAQAPSKIGVFDSQRISEETAEGKKLQTMLGAMRDEKQSEINSKEQAIEDLQQRLSQQGLSLSAETRMGLEVDIQRRMLEVNTLKELATQQLQLEVAAAEASFNEKLRNVVIQFGRDEGFTLLLEASTVAWAANSADVTTALIDIFDRMYGADAE
jgi:Skp family chaperone for outer membrane proteins